MVLGSQLVNLKHPVQWYQLHRASSSRRPPSGGSESPCSMWVQVQEGMNWTVGEEVTIIRSFPLAARRTSSGGMDRGRHRSVPVACCAWRGRLGRPSGWTPSMPVKKASYIYGGLPGDQVEGCLELQRRWGQDMAPVSSMAVLPMSLATRGSGSTKKGIGAGGRTHIRRRRALPPRPARHDSPSSPSHFRAPAEPPP